MTSLTDESTEKQGTRSDAPLLPRIIDASLVVIAFGAVAYFLGWRFLFAYYSGFGLDSSLFKVTPIEVIFAGWRVYLVVAGMLVAATAIWVVCQGFARYLKERRGLRSVILALDILYTVGLALAIYVAIQLIRFYRFEGSANWRFYSLSLLFVTVLWSVYCVGVFINKTATVSGSEEPLPLRFTIVFSLPQLWLAVITVVSIMMLALFTSGVGVIYSARERQPGTTRLPIVTVYVDSELSIPVGTEIRNDVWRYENLRLVTKTDDTYFLFKLDEVIDGVALLYAIPKQRIIEYHTRPWYDITQRP